MYHRIEDSDWMATASRPSDSARWRLTATPFSAIATAGRTKRDQGKRPYSQWAAQYPASSPGTATAKPPAVVV